MSHTGQPKSGGKKGGKKKTGLSLGFDKRVDFADWYSSVITKSEMIDYYDVSGCYILRPWAYGVWEQIQGFFDKKIKELGVQNAYFPVFVTKKALEAEKEHVEGFAPEVAWVTKSGDSDLAEPIALRPTSETIMYPAFSKWVRSHRDLPLRLNQWTNIVRWEFKHPTPFIRTREFLWQEGHSAFSTKEEADVEVLDILDLYARVYEEYLAVPVIKGRKSEKEKFAGGHYTTTVEAFIPTNGRAIQAATSHSLGQNFSKMFNIRFEDKEGKPALAWQNSWGLTTRTIGVMIMVHGDNQGLVLPPRVAPYQVIVLTITSSKDDAETKDKMENVSREVVEQLRAAGVRTHIDERDTYSPGWKFNHWEQKGVPIRIEIGPKDLAANHATVARRDNGTRTTIPFSELTTEIPKLLETIHSDMLAKARKERDESISIVTKWEDFIPALNKGHMVLAPWCEEVDSEEWVKEQTKKDGEEQKQTNPEEAAKGLSGAAKTLCIPFNQPPMPEGTLCFTGNGKPAKSWTLWGRSY